MMSYEDFKNEVLEKIPDYLPEEYQEVFIRPVNKVNCVLDGLTVKANDSFMPTIYINYLYELYEEKIIFQFINTEQNKDFLKTIPHRNFQDLSIIYRWVVDINDDGISSTIVNNDLMNSWKITEDQLFKLAKENTKTLLPFKVQTMKEVVCEILKKQNIDIDNEESKYFLDSMDDVEMYVITNNKGINGAISIVYKECLHELAEKLNSNLYILPSSVHEVIAIKASLNQSPKDLLEMVKEVNLNEVAINEVLSDNIYYYDKTSEKIAVVTEISDN